MEWNRNFLWTSAGMFAALVVSGCVPIPEEQRSQLEDSQSSSAVLPGTFEGLDAGASEVSSQHFLVKAYGSDRARQLSELSENIYNRFLTDTGIYSFPQFGLYRVLIYSGRGEFAKKTQQPEWSTGVVVGPSVYLYDGPQLSSWLTHDLSHLLFFQYMSSQRQDLRWLDEGLAMYEETQQLSAEGLRASWREQWRNAFKTRAIPIDQLVNLTPATERDRMSDMWYQQTGEWVRFMIERGGHNGFSIFLAALRDGHNLDDSIKKGFPGTWTKFSDMETAWKLGL